MPRYLKVNIICILFFVFAVPASSELYQYKDENGITRLTDNKYSVPVEHRSQLEQFSEVEGISDEIEILPLENKVHPQTKIEKVIVPKTSKTISAKAEKNIIPPNIPPDADKKTASKSKKETTSPFQPIFSEKTVQEPDTKLSTRETHKSKKILIDKKTTPSQETAKALPEKDVKKNIEPDATPETVQKPVNKTESKRITKSAGTIPEKNLDPKPKTAQAEPKTVPQKIIPDIREKPAPKIKKAGTDDPDNTLAKKDANSVIVPHKTAQKKLTETEKPEFHSRQITPDEPNLITNSEQTEHTAETVTVSKVIEKESNEVDEKDASLDLTKLETTRKMLAEKKEALNKKYMSLMREKQEIENSVDEDDEKSVLEYNENVKKLNIKIKQYKKKKKILQAEIEKYNNTIRQSALN
ncbi:MAG: hypothetical protein HF978_05030 [Desulfobacteraceae bacterium]|nr:hypothetical protein [Desulfobacteraceae bacterium]MBC2754894.1 hypothetical protein [Desulfobacteraceae bacterium]